MIPREMAEARQIAEALTNAFHRAGIVTYVSVVDYKEAPGGPMLEILLKPEDGNVLRRKLDE